MQKDLNFPRNHKSLRSSAKSQKNMNEKKWRCNRGRDGFRPSYYYLWICFKNSTLYIHPDSAYTPHTHTQTAVAKWRHNRAEASGKPWVQTQHRLLRVVCIPPTWGSSSRRRPFICIHSYETKSWNLSVMRLTFLLCCCERCSECSFRENAIGFPLELSCLWIMHRGRRMEAGGVKEKGCYESHNCLVKRLDGELEAA